MSKYELNIAIDEEELKKLNTLGRKVVIVKSTEESSSMNYGEQITGVAWVTFKPWQYTKVSWENSFAVYASDISLQSGVTIKAQAIKNATPSSKLYSFTTNNIFEELPKEDTHDNTYYINNNCGESEIYTFGLAQSITVQSKKFEMNPINAIPVINKDHAYFTPVEKIKIFLQSNTQNSKVISVTQTDVLDLDLTKNPEAYIRYDSAENKFVIA